MDTLIQYHDGTETTLSEAVEAEDASRKEIEIGNHFLVWEALRTLL